MPILVIPDFDNTPGEQYDENQRAYWRFRNRRRRIARRSTGRTNVKYSLQIRPGMQLDAWDADTSVPAILDGEHSVLYREHYDSQSDAWVMRLA